MQLDFSLPASSLKSLSTGAVIVPDQAAVFRIEGTGALTCLQGLLTSDLVAPGENSLVYGALLTPKGMIVVDPWVLREGGQFTLVLPAGARGAALALFGRVLPPRLARVTDLSAEWKVAWALGAAGPDCLARATGGGLPGAAKVIRTGAGGTLLLAGGTTASPFTALLVGPTPDVEHAIERFEGAAGVRGDERELAAARVLAGWPTLGREIDDKTLPQEVRYDELDAVSYVKGCYTGQETVARVHFRGHVNRSLRGLVLPGGERPDERTLELAGKQVGQMRSAVVLDDRVLALASIRREVEDGVRLQAGQRNAEVVALPFVHANGPLGARSAE